MEPILLQPSGKDYMWGGTRLKTEYGKYIEIDPLAETWECSVHPDGPSFVASGACKGITLDKFLMQFPEYIGSKAEGEFPVLIKFIDAKKDLSVQVHPDDAYARMHENQNGKTEMWYVLDAIPGACVICGFSHDVTPELLRNAVEKGDLDKHLQKIEVHKGDVFFIPPGTIHAIGAGVLVAEVQESSNVTYRVYDYNRVDKDGKKRELNFDKAVQVLNMKSASSLRRKPKRISFYPGYARQTLCRCRCFEVERILGKTHFEFNVSDSSFQVLLCTDGKGDIMTGDLHTPIKLKKGDCVFIPAGMGECRVNGKLELLKIKC